MERRGRMNIKEKAAAAAMEGKERRRSVVSNGGPAMVVEVSSRSKSDVDGSEGEEEEAAAFGEEGVKKKMGVLARMVGMEACGQPGVVLTEVVRVLKELDGRARGVCSSRKG